MENSKVIRGKTLGAWKKYAEENYTDTPVEVYYDLRRRTRKFKTKN